VTIRAWPSGAPLQVGPVRLERVVDRPLHHPSG